MLEYFNVQSFFPKTILGSFSFNHSEPDRLCMKSWRLCSVFSGTTSKHHSIDDKNVVNELGIFDEHHGTLSLITSVSSQR